VVTAESGGNQGKARRPVGTALPWGNITRAANAEQQGLKAGVTGLRRPQHYSNHDKSLLQLGV
jgi:hypothetical protein